MVLGAASLLACGAQVEVPHDDPGELEQGTEGELGCPDPQPILQRDSEVESGFVRCANGLVHRSHAVACEEPRQTGNWVFDCSLEDGECETDDDCTARPYGRCGRDFPWDAGCGCTYGCESDADCEPGRICACPGVAGPQSRCIAAVCNDDADCSSNLCGLSDTVSACGKHSSAMACHRPDASCSIDADCAPDAELCAPNPSGVSCQLREGDWQCVRADDCESTPCG